MAPPIRVNRLGRRRGSGLCDEVEATQGGRRRAPRVSAAWCVCWLSMRSPREESLASCLPAWRALPGAEQVVKDGLAVGDRGVLVGHPTYMAFTGGGQAVKGGAFLRAVLLPPGNAGLAMGVRPSAGPVRAGL